MKVYLSSAAGEKREITVPDSYKLSKNFTLKELANNKCKEAQKYIISPDSMLHVTMLQELRDWWGKAITVSCSYRSPTWNKSVGGIATSSHLKAVATDLNIKLSNGQYESFRKKWQEICIKHGVVGEIGFYSWGVHVGAPITYSKTFYFFDKR